MHQFNYRFTSPPVEILSIEACGPQRQEIVEDLWFVAFLNHRLQTGQEERVCGAVHACVQAWARVFVCTSVPSMRECPIKTSQPALVQQAQQLYVGG